MDHRTASWGGEEGRGLGVPARGYFSASTSEQWRTHLPQIQTFRPTISRWTSASPLPQNEHEIRMQAALRRHVESGLLPGLVALVYHRGRE